jgi:hypothetical protein
MNKASAFFFPNRMGRIILESMEEVVGRNGLNAVLNLAGLGGMIGNYPPSDKKPKFSFEIVSGLMEKLEQAYGPRGGHGLAVRIGRTSFKYGMREFGPQMGLNETAFRFLPFSTKLRIGGAHPHRKAGWETALAHRTLSTLLGPPHQRHRLSSGGGTLARVALLGKRW